MPPEIELFIDELVVEINDTVIELEIQPQILGVTKGNDLIIGIIGDEILKANTKDVARTAIGLGDLSTQGIIPSGFIGITDSAAKAMGSSDVIDDALFCANPVSLSGASSYFFPLEDLFRNEENYTEFTGSCVIEVPCYVVFENGYFLIHGHTGEANFKRPSSVKIEIFSFQFNQWLQVCPDTPWPSDGGNLMTIKSDTGYQNYNRVRYTFTSQNTFRLTKLRWILTRSNTNPVLYKKDNRYQSLAGGLGVANLRINNGATQSFSGLGSKIITSPSTTDTIIVNYAQIGDITRVSRGKDPYVSAPNTVQFDSTGLNDVTVNAIVERFN